MIKRRSPSRSSADKPNEQGTRTGRSSADQPSDQAPIAQHTGSRTDQTSDRAAIKMKVRDRSQCDLELCRDRIEADQTPDQAQSSQ